MKQPLLSFLLSLISLVGVAQQSPLVGTWDLVSAKGVSTSGEAFDDDATTRRDALVITPTHYMLISVGVTPDSTQFQFAHAGAIKIVGNKFSEVPIYGSRPEIVKAKIDYTWKVQGDKFTQSGTVVYPDGKTIKITEIIWQRVTGAEAFPKNPAIGTWDQLSSGFTLANEQKDYHTRQTAVRFRIVTPTHFFQFGQRNAQFEFAVAGTYTIEGGAMVPTFTISSSRLNPDDKTKHYIDHVIEGDVMFVKGSSINDQGKESFRWEDVFIRVKK